MAKNFVQPGDNMTVTAGADIASGAGLRVGMLFGVTQHSALNGAPVVIATRGVYTLPKVEAQAWTVGQALYWTGTQCTTVAGTGNILIGVAAAIAANPSTTGIVRLNGSAPAAQTA
jgi:predicted RecA/RadA family phage recombinase